MLEYPQLFEKFRQFRDQAWESLVLHIETRQNEGAFRAVDPRCLVEAFKSTVVHLANEVMHEEDPPQKERFYQIIDTMIRLMLTGLEP
jgi:hypothetical protein